MKVKQLDTPATCAIEEKIFSTNERGVKIATRVWTPASQDPVALVVVVHGYAAYLDIPDMLQQIYFYAKRGIMCMGIDFEGCGESDGCRMHVPRCVWWCEANFELMSPNTAFSDW